MSLWSTKGNEKFFSEESEHKVSGVSEVQGGCNFCEVVAYSDANRPPIPIQTTLKINDKRKLDYDNLLGIMS